MTSLTRSGSVLVAEIKANHGAGESNGSAIAGHEAGAGVENGAAAVAPTPLVDPSIATPYPAAQANGHAEQAPESTLNAGTGATAIDHAAQPSTEVAPSAMPSAVLPPVSGTDPNAVVPQTVPISGIRPSTDAGVGAPVPLATSDIASRDHAAHGAVNPDQVGSAPGSALEPTSAGAAPGSELTSASPIHHDNVAEVPGAAAPHEEHSALAPAAAVAAPVAVGAGAAAVAHHDAAPAAAPAAAPVRTAAPVPTLSPKEIKKMDKLMKTEAKNESKSLKRAMKDAEKSEKLMRKSRDADVQALKRHEKATTNEHKAAKALNKAKAEHEKCVAELNKALEDLDIKRKHTATTREGYEKAKTQIDTLRTQKQANDRARIDRAAAIHGVRV